MDILNRFPAWFKKIAIVYEETEITYGEILTNISTYEKLLREMGVKQGDIVGIMLSNSPAFIYGLFSIWKIGAIVVPINILLKKNEVKYILEHSGMKVLISDLGFSEMFTECKVVKKVDGINLFMIASHTKPTDISLDEVAIIIYTSGTTDKPKGVMITHENLSFNIAAWFKIIKQDSEDIILLVLPFFHIFGLTLTLLTTLYIGGKGIILSRFDPRKTVDLIFTYQVSIFPGVPTMFTQILNLQHIDVSKLNNLRFCISGGAPISLEILKSFESRYSVPILEGYGLTEASPLVAINSPYEKRKAGSVGKPAPGIMVKIVDDNGLEVSTGEVGEVIVKGKNIMKGYYKLPDITTRVLQNGWLYTGDMGKIDEDGYLYIVDRKKDIIITGGYNVFPKEVEKTLLTHPCVSETAVVGIPDPVKGELVKAFVVLNPGGNCTENDIVNYCKEHMAPFKCPKTVEIIADLPKNTTGKVLKKLLRTLNTTNTVYKDLEIMELSFQSAGAVLSGKLFLPKYTSYPVPLFILSCGIGGRKEWFEPVFPNEISKRNIALFTFDLRGHHPSSGVLDRNIISDIPSAIEYVTTIKEIDPSLIILCGQCLGGILCNYYAARNQIIKGVVNISIFLPNSVNGFFSRQISNFVMEQIRKSNTHSADIDEDNFFEGFVRYLNVLSDATKISRRPYLLIHYLKDPVCSSEKVKDFFEAINNPHKKLVLIDNNHETWISKKYHATSYDDPQVASVVGKWIEENF